VPLAEALRAAGLACRLTHASKERDPAGFDLEVAEAEFLKALAVLDLVPGHDMFLVEARPAPEGGLGESHCPACGTELAEGVLQCLECGLILGSGHEPPPS
jgi:hypothetical protein